MTDYPEAAPAIEAPPVKVHITGSDIPFGKRQAERRLTTFTKVLTAAQPFTQIAPYDPGRICAYIRALDQDTVVSTSLGEAQDAANTTASQPFPDGQLIPKTDTTPTKFEGAQPMWITAAVYPARVTVQLLHESR